MAVKRIVVDYITHRIESLESLYEVLAEGGDIKYLQGLERCIELYMRLNGIDGKSEVDQFTENITENNSMISLRDLSTDTLKELIALSKVGDIVEQAKPLKKITRTGQTSKK